MKQNTNYKFNEKEIYMRRLLVSMMVLSVQYWQQVTLKSKIELAHESEYWTVNYDRGSCQTRTLDRYLKLSSLPNKPNIEAILCTVHFVLKKSSLDSTLRTRLINMLDEYLAIEHDLSLELD